MFGFTVAYLNICKAKQSRCQQIYVCFCALKRFGHFETPCRRVPVIKSCAYLNDAKPTFMQTDEFLVNYVTHEGSNVKTCFKDTFNLVFFLLLSHFYLSN